MGSEPIDEPMTLVCEGLPLHWDKIGKLWVCERCGSSLSYDAWTTGNAIECGAQRLPTETGVPNPQHTYLRRNRAG